MHIKRYIILFVLASLLMLVFSVFTPQIAFADTGDNSQVHTVSSFVPLGGAQVVNDPNNPGNSNASYSPHDGSNSNAPQNYWSPYNPNSPFNYGSPNYGNPYSTYTSASIDPYNTAQRDGGHHYGGNGLPFSGYSNSGNNPLHVQ